jgi:hypothetical protein
MGYGLVWLLQRDASICELRPLSLSWEEDDSGRAPSYGSSKFALS